ncbi:MAG: PrgI family protein [Candidatus Nomurabacteria bacterium]|jgi:hypothetical protein|nr:PrgI family protein [Candidatus Nomurabacteria bacterium]
MGQYKVPQNVEVEDKILGPFSFRQFIYLLIAGLAGFLVWVLGSAFWALGIIPVPVLLFMLVLALPLRKDQPMEIYLLAIVRFMFAPKKRLWKSGSFEQNVSVDAASVNDDNMPIKDIRGPEAAQRLSYLASVLDTAGWSTRGVTAPEPTNSNIVEEVAGKAIDEADRKDLFEDNSHISQAISQRLTEQNTAAPTPNVASDIMRKDI